VRRAAARALALALVPFTTACTGGADAGEGAIDLYQRHVGPQWAFHCPFQPSCSQFARESIATYGLLPGVLMTADRLMRDHDLCYERYPQDELGRPLDPPAAEALFGPRVESSAAQEDAAQRAVDAADRAELSQPPYLQDDEQLAFADRLFDEHAWERARVEYARLLFHRPATPHAERCHQRSALCLARLELGGAALSEVDRMPAGARRDDTRALVLHVLGRSQEGLQAVDTSDAEGRLLAGLLALEAGEPARARAEFGRLDEPLRAPLLERTAACEELPERSRWLAGSLSAVLPGAGQLYAGRPEDALVAFTTNGVLIGATALAWHRKERVTAGALGFVAFGFYLGNVYGGVNAAARHDREARDGLLAHLRGWLRDSNLWMSVAPRGDGGAIGLYVGF